MKVTCLKNIHAAVIYWWSRWWFQIFLEFSPLLFGQYFQFDWYFSDGLKLETTNLWWWWLKMTKVWTISPPHQSSAPSNLDESCKREPTKVIWIQVGNLYCLYTLSMLMNFGGSFTLKLKWTLGWGLNFQWWCHKSIFGRCFKWNAWNWLPWKEKKLKHFPWSRTSGDDFVSYFFVREELSDVDLGHRESGTFCSFGGKLSDGSSLGW